WDTKQLRPCRTGPRCGLPKRGRYRASSSSASPAASGLTMPSEEPSRNTTACNTARSNGLIPNSGGMSGKTAAPSGTSRGTSSAISAPGHRGNDAQLIAILDDRCQVIQVADVLVVQVDVDEAPHLAVLEQPWHDRRKLPPQVLEHTLHGSAGHFHRRLALGVLP